MDTYAYELITVINKDFILTSEEITLFINENDNLVFIIYEKEFIGSKLINLHLPFTKSIHIFIQKLPNTTTLFFNGKEIFSVSSNTILITQNTFTLKEKDIRTKIIHIQKEDLTPWVAYRSSNFKIKSATSSEYILVGEKEQKTQLIDIIDSLKDLINLVNKGKKQHIVHILASLRSLVYYRKGNSSNYDPLLLRLAAHSQVVLPVYTHKLFPDITLDDASFSISPNAQSIPSDFHTKMIDFQNYLELPSIKIDGNILSLLNFIGNAATTKSTAHFDQRIPKVIRAFDSIPVLHNLTIFDRTIINLALLVINIAQIVLKK